VETLEVSNSPWNLPKLKVKSVNPPNSLANFIDLVSLEIVISASLNFETVASTLTQLRIHSEVGFNWIRSPSTSNNLDLRIWESIIKLPNLSHCAIFNSSYDSKHDDPLIENVIQMAQIKHLELIGLTLSSQGASRLLEMRSLTKLSCDHFGTVQFIAQNISRPITLCWICPLDPENYGEETEKMKIPNFVTYQQRVEPIFHFV